MMRAAVVRSRPLLAGSGRSARNLQWPSLHHPRPNPTSYRSFADGRKADETVLPGSSSAAAPGTPPAPTLTTANTSAAPIAGTPLPPAENVPKVPPPPPSAPTTPIAPKPKKRRTRWLLYLFLLTVSGYAGGTYYALRSDNFHDFFTEYIPFGEEAVLFFEEQEFRRRFPDGRPSQRQLYPQTSGENKVTVPGRSGVSPKVASEAAPKASDKTDRALGSAKQIPSPSKAVEKAKEAVEPKKEQAKAAVEKAAEKVSDAVKPSSKPAPAPTPAKPIDNLNIENAADPVVQEITKILNDIITVVNADNAGSKYSSTIDKAKDSVKQLATNISSFQDLAAKAADEQKRQDQIEFDNGAKELLRRIEVEQKEQELKFREEWESEREKLSKSYQEKLRAEVESAQKIADQKLKNELLEQAKKLQDSFAASVKDRVESERSGRLSKLNDLSNSVSELESLTSQWTKVLDANLKTQHLVVAVDAVRSIMEDPEKSKPFLHELAALKEIAEHDSVVDAAIGSIKPSAYQRGLPTSAQLIDRFRRVAGEVRKASLLPEDAGAASHAASFVLSKVMFKKQGLAVGEDVESVLTRTETFLEEGNLDEAAREMNSLQGWAKILSRDWLADCRTVLEARQAMEVIATQAKLQSLLVD